MTGVELGLAIGLGALGAGTSIAGATMQNRAIRRAAKVTSQAAQIQAKQVSEAAMVDRQKAARQADLVRGRIRVAAAAAGIAPDAGTFSMLSQQEAFDYAFNQAVLEQNRRNQVASVISGGAASIAGLMAQRQNALLSGIQGGLAGAQTGLSIGGAIGSGGGGGGGGSIGDIGGAGGAPSYGGGFGPRTGGFGSPTAFA